MEFLFVVEVDLEALSKSNKFSREEMDKIAFQDFESLGKLEYSIDEKRVDEILGEKAFCGGDLPEDVFQDLETQLEGETSGSYFWNDKEAADKFANFCEKEEVKFEMKSLENQDWNEKWRENFKEIIISENLKVTPSWDKKEDNTKEVFIYPGMGFGTGNHETTYLCLKLFEKIVEELNESDRCLDFGCGSGILGIAALKKLKSSVDFVDIDVDALDNCLLNLQLNEFEDYNPYHELVLRDRYQVKEEAFPIVFANILENVLLLERETITRSTKKKGYLIISGLLKGQETEILKAYEKDFKLVEMEVKGDWVALLTQRIDS